MSPVQLSETQIQAISNALRSAREKRGDNIAEAAFRIALSPSQLRAIESGDLRPFYNHHYFLQAAKRYANHLGVDLPAPKVDSTPEASPKTAPAAEFTPLVAAAAAPITPLPVTHDQQSNSESIEADSTTDPMPENSAAQGGTGVLRWGWIALAAAGLIALGILKISLEQTPRQEPVVASAQSLAAPTADSDKPVEAVNSSPGPATPPPATPPPATSARPPQASQVSDGQLAMQASTWVQIVKNNGEKINLKTEPGQRVEFPSGDTAALVFGQPEKANLTLKGRAIDLGPFITQDSPPRALVILNRIKE